MGPDVQNCSKNFPRAIMYAAGMQTVINGTIHLVASGATDPALYPKWEPGYLRWGLYRTLSQGSINRQPIFPDHIQVPQGSFMLRTLFFFGNLQCSPILFFCALERRL